MAYTPINWQTGDTITAEKLNRCDNGWGYENTELFSETVTTELFDNTLYRASFVYSDLINVDNLIVMFDGTEYTCSCINMGDESYLYGGFSASGPDFTNYPFLIESTDSGNGIFTETVSTHTVVVVASTLQTSAGFTEALSATVGGAFYPLIIGKTTWQQVVDAIAAGKLVFYSWSTAYDEDSMISNSTYANFGLVTEAYISSHGDFCVSLVTGELGSQSIISFNAATADGVLNNSQNM